MCPQNAGNAVSETQNSNILDPPTIVSSLWPPPQWNPGYATEVTHAYQWNAICVREHRLITVIHADMIKNTKNNNTVDFVPCEQQKNKKHISGQLRNGS